MFALLLLEVALGLFGDFPAQLRHALFVLQHLVDTLHEIARGVAFEDVLLLRHREVRQ